ncbi:hypothetical protein OG204_15940 [Streptomyces sp. NBC_01387]|uniref:hypothetical protein n=1 Tax=unclassified Streptomyces TaxID=2593676 RepID=UPI002E2F9232|nr:hypothetical protein [Streptomyces sp. NBC_01267]
MTEMMGWGDNASWPDGDLSARPLGEMEAMASRSEPQAVGAQVWETLRELGSGRMRQNDLAAATRLRWARLALLAATRKAEAATGDAQAALTDAVYLRAAMIRTFGTGPTGGDRDPADLVRTVLHTIGRSPAEVASAAVGWRPASPADMLGLRRIKNLLTGLKGLDAYLDQADPLREEMAVWLSLIPRLP